MKYRTYTVNAAGIEEIRQFLEENHRQKEFTEEMLHAWAQEAEFQLGEGNAAAIELKARDSIHGTTQEYYISEAGLDATEHDDED